MLLTDRYEFYRVIYGVRLVGQLTRVLAVIGRRQTSCIYGLISTFGVQYETGNITWPWIRSIILKPIKTTTEKIL